MRSLALILPLLGLAISPAAAQAPVPGRNVNMVTVDPYLQKQNEPSVAVIPVNPCHLLAGANDYRAVNIPGLPEDKEIGDAWVGWYTSIDCGQTWKADLMPGFPQDNSAQGLASPVKGLSTAADPTVRSGAGGFVAYSFIAFNRGTNVGKVAVARAIDHNNKEAGNPIQYLDTKIWDSGSAGQFIDKPYMLVTPGSGTCSLGGRTIPASTVHLVWTVFVGNSDQTLRTKVYYARSSNCGGSLDFPPTKLSEGYPINQGASLAVTPSGSVNVAWRQFATPKGDTDQILFARSADGGKTFTKAVPILSSFVPFDQGTTSRSFRTNAFPTMTSDQFGRVYLAVSSRNSSNQARVMVTTTTDGLSWTTAQPVEATSALGHQIQPAMTYSGGKIRLAWVDFRDDVSGEFHDYIKEIYPKRHTMDIRGAEAVAVANTPPAQWTTFGIIQDAAPTASVPRISRYREGNYGGTSGLKQLQFNPPNMKLYAGGSRPFAGDFIDIGGLGLVPNPSTQGQWLLNDGTIPFTGAQVSHTVWTDNRDALTPPSAPEPVDETLEGHSTPYFAPGTDACRANPANGSLTHSRNANVYTSRISPGLFVAAPGNAKPTGPRVDASNNPLPALERAFAVYVQNDTGQVRTFQLTLRDVPSDSFASFTQFPVPVNPNLPPAVVTQISATVAAKSTVARTVYVYSATRKYPRVKVDVTEPAPPGGTTALPSASTILNPDIENPDIENPDIENPDIENPDIENAEVHNPDIENPDIENPDIENPDIENPDIENPDIENPDIENPDIENPDIENPDIENPDIENPDIENPDIENSPVTDYSVEFTNDGNTTTSYQIQTDVGGDTSGYVFQLIGQRIYKLPAAVGCEPSTVEDNELLFNITNPDLSPGPLPDANLADPTLNPTVLVRPGERIKITLRAWDKDGVISSATHQPFPGGNGTIEPFCPMLGGLCTTLTNTVITTVQAQPTNTGATTPASDTQLSNPYAAPLTITTASLPPGEYDEGLQTPSIPYSQQLQATGGNTGNYSWSVIPCGVECLSGLPPGLSLSPSGLISGMPSATGIYPVTIQVTDGLQTTNRALSITVIDLYENLVFTQQPPAFVAPGTSFPVSVELRDGSNAVVPGAEIQLALVDNPTGAQLTPAAPTAMTNAAGTASFVVSVDRAGSYRLIAWQPSPTTPVAHDSNQFEVGAPLVVINTNDSGAGSLRQAITDANATPGRQTITFNIPGAGVHTIALQSILPSIIEAVVIDATSQPGFAGSPLVELNGAGLPQASNPGLHLAPGSDGSTVRGLAIGGFDQTAMRIQSTGNTVQGNYIGLSADGVTPRPNVQGIMILNGSNNVIGGEFPGERNVIGGNSAIGVVISLADSTGNVVRGNVIGQDPDTQIGAANGGSGVLISDGAANNVIGGTEVGTAQNVIMRNGGAGVAVITNTNQVDPASNTIRLNRIDENASIGIDLGLNGVTANDAGDADAGPNDLQNWPSVDTATTDGTTLTVSGTLNSTVSTGFVIDVYYSPSCATGDREGRTWVAGATNLFTNVDGNATFNIAVQAPNVPAGSYVTATATRAVFSEIGTLLYSTSEFSSCTQVTTTPVP